MLRCECGWEATVLHAWSLVFQEIYMYAVDGTEANVICPGCHQVVYSDSLPHERPNTKEEVENKGATLWGLNPLIEVDTYAPNLPPPYFLVPEPINTEERVRPNPVNKPVKDVGVQHLRLIPGKDGEFGRIELVQGPRTTPATRGERVLELAMDPETDKIFEKTPPVRYPEVDFREEKAKPKEKPVTPEMQPVRTGTYLDMI